MMAKYSFIYFDVGGVLLKDFSCTNQWEEMKRGLGVNPETSEDFERVWEQYAEKRACLDYDVDCLMPILIDKLKLRLPHDFSLLQDFVDRFERNEGIWKIVEKVKKEHRVGLLTNMFPGMLAKIDEAGLLNKVNWDVVVDSSIVKHQKPEEQIFKHAQKLAGVDSSKILFIDNTMTHLRVAGNLGWQTYHYDSCNYEQSNKDLLKYITN